MDEVITVRGPIHPDELGVTSVHEHLLMDNSWLHDILFKYPIEKSKLQLVEAKLSIENLAVARRHHALIKDNMRLDSEEVAIKEIKEFVNKGGKSIVDVSVPDHGRDVVTLKRISQKAEVNVVAATGWYTAPSHPPYVKKKTVIELRDIMIKELTEEIENTGIRAGVIKCAIGGLTGDPNKPLADYVFHKEEEKVLRAGAKAQEYTNAPMTIHTCVFRKDSHEYLDVLEEENVNLEKCWLSHLDITYPDLDIDYCKSLMDRGVSISFDCFGFEKYSESLYLGTCITDKERVKTLIELCESGYDKNIMLGQDISNKDRLKKYGGYGYSHVLENILPEIERKGVSKNQIRNMVVENPKKTLVF